MGCRNQLSIRKPYAFKIIVTASHAVHEHQSPRLIWLVCSPKECDISKAKEYDFTIKSYHIYWNSQRETSRNHWMAPRENPGGLFPLILSEPDIWLQGISVISPDTWGCTLNSWAQRDLPGAEFRALEYPPWRSKGSQSKEQLGRVPWRKPRAKRLVLIECHRCTNMWYTSCCHKPAVLGGFQLKFSGKLGY